MSTRKPSRPRGYQAAERLRNTARVLSLLRGTNRWSRIDLSREMGVDRSTVTGITNELLKAGLVQETGQRPPGSQTAGRPAVLLALNPGFGLIAGIEFHLKEYRLSLVDLRGTVVHREAGATSYPAKGFDVCCEDLLRKVEDLALKKGLRVLGAVLGISAAVDPVRQKIVRSFVYNLRDHDFRGSVSSRFSYPVIVENDANCCAAGELAPERRNILYLLARTTALDASQDQESGIGIGMGIVSDGRLHYGAGYASGELRAADWVRTTQGQLSLSWDDLADVRRSPVSLRRFIEEITYNLSPLISVFDPDCIILGGDLRDHLAEVGRTLETSWPDRYVHSAWEAGLFKAPANGEYEVSDGAARLLLLLLFDQEAPLPDEGLRWDSILRRAKAAQG